MRAILLAVVTLTLTYAAPALAQEGPPLEPYPLDDIARTVEVRGKIRCPEVPLERHAGEAVKWRSTLKVHPAFAARLTAFEEVVKQVAIEIYGRAPKTIDHLGSYNCRRIRRYPDLLSEHGLGNAIDVAGFVFPALTRAEAKTSTLPKALRRGFKVTVLEHWHAEGADDSAKGYHRRFLRALASALEKRPDIFRVLLGPAYPGHHNHFHFDCAPYRLVVM